MRLLILFGSLLTIALIIVLIVGTITAAFEPNGKDFRIMEIMTDNKYAIYCKTYIGRWVPLFKALKKNEFDNSVLVIEQKGTKRVDEIEIKETYDTQEEASNVLNNMVEKLRESSQRKSRDNIRTVKNYRV